MTGAIQTDQLPAGARISQGSTQKPVGVIADNLLTEGDVLRNQAIQIAKSRPGAQLYNGVVPQEVVERVRAGMVPGILATMNADTINALAEGTLQRDQAFTGNNANFTGYYLQPGAEFVIPQTTPLRNRTPRLQGPGIDTMNYRSVTDYFGGSGPSVGQFVKQQQGTIQKLSYNWVSLTAIFKTLAAQDIVTQEADIYGRMFQGDVRATVAAKLIPALMQGQEIWMINGGQKCWTPPPIQMSASTAAGSLAAGTYWFIITAANANGETLGTSIQSVVLSGTGQVTLTIFTVPGATKYNVYAAVNASKPANSAMWLQSASSNFGGASALNQPGGVAQGWFQATMTSLTTSGTAFSTLTSNTAIMYKSTDTNTTNLPLVYDGLQALIFQNAAAASTMGVQGQTPLVYQPAASNGALAQSDLDATLENMYLNSHADPDWMGVSVKDHRTVSQIVAQATNFRVNVDINSPDMGNLTAGLRATKYINQTTGKVLDIIMLPYLTQGTVVFGSDSIPFPVSAIERPPFRVEYNKDMWAMELPPDQSHPDQWMYNAFCNETVVCQFLGGFAAITGIKIN